MTRRILGIDYGAHRTFTTHISDFVKSGNSGIEYQIILQANRGSKGAYWMNDDSEIPFEGDKHGGFFTLGVQTEKSFTEVMKFFRKIGFPLTSRVVLFSYDGNLVKEAEDNFLGALERRAEHEEGVPHRVKSIYQHGKEDESKRYHQSPFLFGHLLNPDFLAEVDKAVTIYLRMFNADEGNWRGVNFIYEQSKRNDFFRGEILYREVAYQDERLNQMLLSQIVSTSPFQLNTGDRDLLEDTIKNIIKSKKFRPEQLDLFEREPGMPFTGNLPNP